MVRLNNIRKMPSTRAITVKCISEEAQAHLEESFHIGDVAFIHHKQNHVVIRFSDIRASHNDVIASNDGTDCRARRQFNLTHDAILPWMTCCHRERSPQWLQQRHGAAYINHIAPTHMRQQAADGCLLW